MKDLNTIPRSYLNVAEDEIDLVALAKTVWEERKIIIKITLIFLVLGFFIAIFTPNKYSVTALLVPQGSSGGSKMGGLSSLAAMAGFNMDMGTTEELSPRVYPKIVQSVPFKRELLQTKIKFNDIPEPVSLYDYYTNEDYQKFSLLGSIKKYTIGLPGLIISAFRDNTDEAILVQDSNNEIIALSPVEYQILQSIGQSVYLNADDKEGTLSLVSIMPEALASAQLGQTAVSMLQRYITKYKIQKAKEQLDFIRERFEVKKSEFEQAQMNLAKFHDRNKFMNTAIARTEEDRLQSEYQIAFSVYNELAKQLESAKIKVKEDTPVLTIIEPITIPNEKFEPKRSLIIFIWVFVGVIVGIGWVFGKQFFEYLKKKWEDV